VVGGRLADLDRFGAFLHERHPRLAKIIAAEIRHKASIVSEHPLIGRAIVARMIEVRSGIGRSADISFPRFRSAQPGAAAAMKSFNGALWRAMSPNPRLQY
jgi:hypothetical protein